MKRILLCLFIALSVVACKKKPDPDNKKSSLTLSVTSLEFNFEGGVEDITLTTKELWSAEVENAAANSWCTINPTSGNENDKKITVSVTPNDTPDERTAKVVVTAGTMSKSVTVKQTPMKGPDVSATEVEFASMGGEEKIAVTSDASWTAEVESSTPDVWCTVSPANGEAGETMLKVTAAANDTPDAREAKITITAGTKSKCITVKQAQKDMITILTPEFEVKAEGGEITVSVESNIEFDITSNSWIKRIETRGMSASSYTFKVEENVNPTKREGAIVFKSKSGDISQSVKILQQRGDTNIESPEDGGEYEWQN